MARRRFFCVVEIAVLRAACSESGLAALERSASLDSEPSSAVSESSSRLTQHYYWADGGICQWLLLQIAVAYRHALAFQPRSTAMLRIAWLRQDFDSVVGDSGLNCVQAGTTTRSKPVCESFSRCAVLILLGLRVFAAASAGRQPRFGFKQVAIVAVGRLKSYRSCELVAISRFILIPPVRTARICFEAPCRAPSKSLRNRCQALRRTRLRGQGERAVAAVCAGAGAGALPAQRRPFAAHGQA